MTIASTAEIIQDFRAGRMVILVDEEDRENEGDLVLAADFVTPEAINFMARYGRGLICLTLTEDRCRQLRLPLMVSSNGARHGTNFTVSIEAAEGVTTGISAADRSRTVQAAVARDARPEDIVQPGHIFPLMAQPGGVLVRAGHTEAGCDLAQLADLTPAAVICEILKDDGTMARLPDLVEFAAQHGLKIGTIADLIHYRSAHESLVERIVERDIETAAGPFRLIGYRDRAGGEAHLALVHGDVAAAAECLVRVHEPLSVLELLDARLARHSWPLDRAMRAIAGAQAGVVVLLNCAQSSDALVEQLASLADAGSAAERAAGRRSKMDLRTYGIGAQILKDLGIERMRLLSQPRKMPSMTGFGLEIASFEPIAEEPEA
ncbi:MAG: bifunctional 3,4-dihydroxy-2-butanone-4-phosphate synthase/GTP cyclohydrolase II [Burkholderiaceae bacterium]|nr:bifunctional 3,4-dihydroxy-2-butanone-4-phosphate synthase/GTP cyclohydrolase II [Burkholderiaceae bacterium]MEB2320676.1 bifunctional 3,4-dihydroxy-2-butanone-4-phosphate synthase/GTP cyclohydrolase II [Pseudomonadota bacterium]